MAALHVEKKVRPPFQASKWLNVQVLSENLEKLFELGKIYPLKGYAKSLTSLPNVPEYALYVSDWKQGKAAKLPDFAYAFTLSEDALYAIDFEQGYRIKPKEAIVEITPHYMSFGEEEVKSNVFGTDTLSWGIQFGFPQLYEDEQGEIRKHLEAKNYPLFKEIQKYLRENTIPAKFKRGDQIIQSSIRVDKDAHDWVNQHPWLKTKNITLV